nr:glycosyl hydrolase family 28-related protein [uncultured Actinomyces sp.]
MKRGPFIAGVGLLGVIALVPALIPSAVAADGQYGATVPYTRYEAEEASRSDGATLERSDDLESTAIEASGQSYVALTSKDASLDFVATTAADALDLRFTLPDHTSGRVDVRVNNETVATLDLSSETAWQYVGGDHVYDEPGEGTKARFRFDEVHTLLGRQIQKDDHIQIVKVGDDQNAYGIDFVELEQAAPAIERPEGAVSVADYQGAKPGDGVDDSDALIWAMNQAAATSKTVYIPAGTWEFGRKIGLDHSGLTIQGAGMWHTNVRFTSDQAGGGGFVFNRGVGGVTMTDFYMSSNLTSRFGEKAQYKGFAGSAGANTRVANVWVEHFECGFWMGDYVDASQMTYTDGMVIENARIRNNFADGVNFAQGTANSTVRNSSVRGNGDDGLASWSSIDTSTNSQARIAERNSFVGNTVELGWRASAIGLFGGKSHVIKDNLIVNNFSGAGIRLNTVFDGHNFDLNTDGGISISHNKLVRSGTTDDFYGNTRGAIDFQEAKGDIRNVVVSDNLIVRPYAAEIRADFGLGQDALSARGITLRDNKRDDEAMDTAQATIVNHVLVGDQVVRTVPETENYSLYWYQRDERGAHGTINRYWVSKADGVAITPDMEYSVEGGKRVYNVTLADLPQYLPTSTDFSGSYDYVADLERSQPADDGMTIVIRFWSAK